MGTLYDSKETNKLKQILKEKGEIKCYIELCQARRDDPCNRHLTEKEKDELIKKYKDKFYVHYPGDKNCCTQTLLYNPSWSYGWNYSNRKHIELNKADDSFGWQNRTYDETWLICRGIHVCVPEDHRVKAYHAGKLLLLPVICYEKDFIGTSKSPDEYRGGKAVFNRVLVYKDDWKQYVDKYRGERDMEKYKSTKQTKNKKHKPKMTISETNQTMAIEHETEIKDEQSIPEKCPQSLIFNPTTKEIPMSTTTIQKISDNKAPLSIGFVLGLLSTMITSNSMVKELVRQKMNTLFPHLDNSQLNTNLVQCSSYLQTIANTLQELNTTNTKIDTKNNE